MLELRRLNTGEVNAQFLLCQVKMGEHYIEEETEDGFVWKPEASDLLYWEGANAPVIVIVIRPATEQGWWIAVDEAFPDPDDRPRRRVRFDKRRDELVAESSDALWAVARREQERRAVVTGTIVGGPYTAVGLRADLESAQTNLDKGQWHAAAVGWSALAAAARGKGLDRRLIWPAEEQAARALEASGQRKDAALKWRALAKERVDDDDPQAAFDLARALHLGLPNNDFVTALTWARAELPEAGIQGLEHLRAVHATARSAGQRQASAAALVDAFVFFGRNDEALQIADQTLGKRHDTAAKRQLALDRLDAAAAAGTDVSKEWDALVIKWEKLGPAVHGVALQRCAIAYLRTGAPEKARDHFLRAAELWAVLDGGDEQVAEAAFSAAQVGDLAGQIAPDRMPTGARQAAAMARGSVRTPAARSDRLVTAGLGFLADHQRPDALKRLTLAAMVDRRAGNLFSFRRSAYFLARSYEDADEWAEALRFWLMLGSESRASEAANHLKPSALVPMLRLTDGTPWERAASYAALERHAAELSQPLVDEIAEAVVSAAEPPFRMIAPQPSFYARRVLAKICDRLPFAKAGRAGKILSEDVERGAPNAPESSQGLMLLQMRGAYDAVTVITSAILSGRDLPVTIRDWLRDADEQVQRPIVEAALAGNRIALTEAAAADLPNRYGELRAMCDDAIRAAAKSEADDGSEIIGASFVDLADLARFCSPRSQGRFVNMLTEVIASPRYDEISKTSALISMAIAAPGFAMSPCRRALTALLPIASGDALASAPSVTVDHVNPKRARTRITRSAPPAAIRSAAIQACGRLALRCSPRSPRMTAMLELALADDEPEVVRMALRELANLPDQLPALDLQPYVEDADDAKVRSAAMETLFRRSEPVR